MELIGQPQRADLPVGLQSVVCRRGKVAGIERIKGARVVEDIQTFRPRFPIVLVDPARERSWRGGIGIRAQGEAFSDHLHATRSEASDEAHAVELGQGRAVVE